VLRHQQTFGLLDGGLALQRPVEVADLVARGGFGLVGCVRVVVALSSRANVTIVPSGVRGGSMDNETCA